MLCQYYKYSRSYVYQEIFTLIENDDSDILLQRFLFEFDPFKGLNGECNEFINYNIFDTATNLQNPSQLIPYNIFQTWKNKNLSDCRTAQLIKLNPEYNYHLYDDNQRDIFMNDIMITEFDGKLTKIYNMIHPLNGAAKSDIWRYAILWKYGGIYADTDVTCFVPFADIIHANDSAILTSTAIIDYTDENEIFEIIQWQMIFTPKHIMLTETLNVIMDYILNKENQNKYKLRQVNNKPMAFAKLTKKITGPFAHLKGVRNAIKKYNLKNGIDYRLWGYIWNGYCKHYNKQKKQYHKNGITHYHKLKDVTFIK